ncbi:DUF3320 domain-containing protein [Rhodococcus sp. D-6]|uniref:DUF3320 domain-containing protein n=1 Tax=Rhodococcus sp. D-6 TaxID=1387842 RepID=A0AAU7UYM6_9NOCA|nr:DUF3320 domain-containing protein [Rhodococcus sp. HS-D2]
MQPNHKTWVELFPWLDGYVSRKAAILENLAPDLDWWFSQMPDETALYTELPALCGELARIFVARHATDRLHTAFPAISSDLNVSVLGLDKRALAGLAYATGLSPDTVALAPLKNSALQFSIAELTASPGIGAAAAYQIAIALIENSVTTCAQATVPVHVTDVVSKFAIPYTRAPEMSLGSPNDLDKIRSREVSDAIDYAIVTIVDIEGPIRLDHLTRRIIQGFGFDRASTRRQEQVKRRIPRTMIHRSRLGTFVWPEHRDPETWLEFRRPSPGTIRPLSDIPPEEIANAMCRVASNALNRDALFRRTAELFGVSRISASASDRLHACLDLLLISERVKSDGLTYSAHSRVFSIGSDETYIQ